MDGQLGGLHSIGRKRNYLDLERPKLLNHGRINLLVMLRSVNFNLQCGLLTSFWCTHNFFVFQDLMPYFDSSRGDVIVDLATVTGKFTGIDIVDDVPEIGTVISIEYNN